MTQPAGLKVSASSLSRAGAGRASNPNTLSRLQALDKNGDGQLDLVEVCDAIDEIVRKEKTERTLKWLLAALAVFSLLTIAATVGLTYAVVVMSQDTQVDGSVLQSKGTGEALRTGSFLQSQNATALLDSVNASNDPGAVLGRIKTIKVPSLKEGEAYTVHKVDAVTMLANGSALVRTSTGLEVLMPAGVAEPATTQNGALPVNATETIEGQGRKLRAFSLNCGSTIIYKAIISGLTKIVLPFAVSSGDTIGSVKDKIYAANPDAPPRAMVQVVKRGTAANIPLPELADATILRNVPGLGFENSGSGYPCAMEYNIEVASYSVNIYITNAVTGVKEQYAKTVRVPLRDTIGGIKREVKNAYSHAISTQTLIKRNMTRV